MRIPRLPAHPRRTYAAALLLTLGVHAQPVGAELPQACAPCLVGGSVVPFLGTPGSSSSYAVAGARGTVRQSLERETFNWSTFNIGADNALEFRQPSSASVALNRIHDTADPTRILGRLSANGQVFLINKNGILFEPGASVDVNTLIASSLPLNAAVDEALNFTELAQTDLASAFSADGGPAGDVQVGAGATLRAARDGRIVLIGGNVTNAGDIEVSGRGGQALLAAENDEIYVLLANDPNVRGLAVALRSGGTVTNTGTIDAGHGNVTLAGLAVNQDGVIRATTAVDSNGSVRLEARDQSLPPVMNPNFARPQPQRGGQVVLGSNSRVELTPDRDDPSTAIDAQPLFQSDIAITGRDVVLESGSVVHAPGGRVAIQGSSGPAVAASPDGTVTVESGAVVDVAGLDDVTLPVSRNIVSQEIRRNELAGSPAQRGGPLFGEVVHFDLRKGVPAIADVAAAISNLGRDVSERSTAGGAITLEGAASVTLEPGAVLDVSGGAVTYTPDYVETTKLVLDGRVVDIAEADPRVAYDAVLGGTSFEHERWGPQATETFYALGVAQAANTRSYEPGYLEGKDAGSITLDARVLDVRGTLRARTLSGAFQRLAPGENGGFVRPFDELPRGGAATLSSFTLTQAWTYDAAGFGFEADGIADYALDGASFTLTGDAHLELAPGGSLRVNVADHIVIDGAVSGAGAEVSLTANPVTAAPGKIQDAVGSITLGPGARVDLEGRLVVEPAGPDANRSELPLTLDGGRFAAEVVGDLVLSPGSVVDVGGGARVLADRSVEPGDGGSVVLSAGTFNLDEVTVDLLDSSAVVLGSAFHGFTFPGAANPASFTLTAPQVALGGTPDPAAERGTVTLPVELFEDRGFHAFAITSAERVLGIAESLDVRARNLELPAGAALAAGVYDVDGLARDALLAPRFRSPTRLSLDSNQLFSTLNGAAAPNLPLDIASSVVLTVDTGGAIAVSNEGSLVLRGTLNAPSGEVALDVVKPGNFGYLPSLGLFLDPGSRIDVAGTFIATEQDTQGRGIAGQLTHGGTVTLNGRSGYVIGFPGSAIDVGGATGTLSDVRLDARSFATVPVTLDVRSDAGAVEARSGVGIQLFSELTGTADAALGAAGGALALTLDANLRLPNFSVRAPNVDYPATVKVSQAGRPVEELRVQLGNTVFPAGLTSGGDVPVGAFDVAAFDRRALDTGGFDRLVLTARPNLTQKDPQAIVNASPTNTDPLQEAIVELVGTTTVSLGRSLELNAPIVQSDGGDFRLYAPYVALGIDAESFVTSDTPVIGILDPPVKYFRAETGTGSAHISGEVVDLQGFTSLHGFGGAAPTGSDAPVTIAAAGDLRLRGVRTPASISRSFDGALVAKSDLSLSARRIFGTTLTDFLVLNEAPGATTRLSATGADAGIPLSAGSRLELRSDRIVQDARVFAPLGEIVLDAEARLTLTGRSLTSTSLADTVVPFGRTQAGEWVFPFTDANRTTLVFSADEEDAIFELPPDKRISLVADGVTGPGGAPQGVIDIRPGARLDVRSGGTALATEFASGPLGKADILDAGAGDRAFAVLPLIDPDLAPFDPLESPAFAYDGTTRVRLFDGTSDLAAGDYAVLPPRYALLPGALLLTPTGPEPGARVTVAVPGAQPTADGLPVVNGVFRQLGDTGASSLTGSFIVENGAQVRNRAEYVESDANDFFAAQAADFGIDAPLLPRDAGAVSIASNLTLDLGGRIVAENNQGGRGSRVDIAGDAFVIAPERDGVPAGAIVLSPTQLTGLGADSILIGGTRTARGASTRIENVSASAIRVDGASTLALPELLLVATDDIVVEAGAELRASGAPSVGAARLEVDGDGALLMASARGLPAYTRTGASAGSTAALTLETGASLFASGAVILDSSGSTVLDGALSTAAGAGARLGAERISLGDAPGGVGGLVLSEARLAELDVARLELTSAGSIDFFGDLALTFNALLLDGAGLRGAAGVGQVAVTAQSLETRNTRGSLFDATGAGDGTLVLRSTSFLAGTTAGLDPALPDDGDFDIAGFATVAVEADTVLGNGAHETQVDGALTLRTDLLASRTGSRLGFGASGQVQALARGAGGRLDVGEALTGDLRLAGASLFANTHLSAPSGRIALSAALGNVTLGAAAVLDVAGLNDAVFGAGRISTDGGLVFLVAETGDIDIGAGARIDVSGGRGLDPASGGELRLVAPAGTLSIANGATLAGGAAAGRMGSGVALDVHDLAPALGFSGLNDRLNAGTFGGARDLRLRGPGTLTVAADDRIAASRITLVNDGGAIELGGTLDANGANAGDIRVVAAGDLVLGPNAVVSARASGGFLAPDGASFDDGVAGGYVELASAGGRVRFETAGADRARIDVTGTAADGAGALAAADNGRVVFVAPRTAANGVNIDPVEATITGARTVDIVGNARYTLGQVGTITGAATLTDNTSGTGLAGQNVRVVPGIEIHDAGPFTATGLGLNLATLFNNGVVEPGILTFRSGADLTIGADLKDGTGFDALFGTIADANASWTMRFAAGADLDSADALRVNAGGGDLRLNANVDVWTGTGNLDLVAGGDVSLAAGATVLSLGRHDDLLTYKGPFVDAFFPSTRGVSFPEQGGDVRIAAGGNVDVVASTQDVRDWTYYYGADNGLFLGDTPRAWGYFVDSFRQNVASLAGGALDVTAGGSINGGQYTTATSGRQVGESVVNGFGGFETIVTDVVDELGGGALTLRAGEDILGVDVTVVRGTANVRARGAIDTLPGASPRHPRLVIGDAQFSLSAGRDLLLGAAIDPTMLSVSPQNPLQLAGVPIVNYFSMTSNASLSLTSVRGDVEFRNPTVPASGFGIGAGAPQDALNLLPGDVRAVAPGGNVYLSGDMSLFPTPRGTLELLARDDISPTPGVTDAVSVTQVDADPDALPTSDLGDRDGNTPVLIENLGLDIPGARPVHAGDRRPNLIVARDGDVERVGFELAKRFELEAGRDVSTIALDAKHVNPGDTSLVRAGRDVIQDTVRNSVTGALTPGNTTFYVLGGPGEVTFLARRDINMGTSQGIVSTGARDDRRLPEAGVSVNLLAGLTDDPDYDGFIERFLVTENRYAAMLAGYLATLAQNGRVLLAGADPVTRFKALDEKDQVGFLLDILYTELQESGIAASTPDSALFQDYSRGFEASRALFPGLGSAAYDGDLRTPLSTVQTQEGGSIRVAVPGGLVDAGLATSDVGAGGQFKRDDELGYIVFREGDFRALVSEDFNVNSTRVFVQQGGDVLIWATNGDIDAGRGATSAANLGIPAADFDAFGNFLDKPPLQVVGSGIRNFAPSGVEPGSIFLFAPRGVINAGDAGIGSAGNLFLGAIEVIGQEFVDAGGIAVGVPAGDTGGVSVGLTAVGDVAANATRATEKATENAAARDAAAQAANAFGGAQLSIISVEVLGFGG